jgi:antitoxin (DNA-binding transcriptional repressor) of toxin-antitoxin stability system
MPAKPITYRDLRNTPAKVFERLASGEPLSLVADGTTKAILIPVENGDASAALDAWKRGRALLALARLQANARRDGTASLGLAEITREIKAQRKSRRAREAEG